MKYRCLFFALVAFAVSLLTACGDSDGDMDKIVLDKDQPSSVSIPANVGSGQVRFTAPQSWSANASTTPKGPGNDIEWLHVETNHGQAGKAFVNFTLDYNATGVARTGYINILCAAESAVITVTQTADEDPDNPDKLISGFVEIKVDRYNENSGEGYICDGTTNYSLTYEAGRPVRYIARWRDDLAVMPGSNGDSYCMNVEEYRFDWDGNTLQESQSVKADGRTEITYYPSERKEYETGEHYAEMKNGRATSGWYWWPGEDDARSQWSASYDTNGYLSVTRNNDASPQWDTHTFTWENGCLKKIVSSYGRTVTFTYADPDLKNHHEEFDVNWVIPAELECYDFAAGDVSRIFASVGLMGNPSKLLLTEISESDGNTTVSYRMDYEVNSPALTKVKVVEFVNGVQQSYSEWEIEYVNIH